MLYHPVFANNLQTNLIDWGMVIINSFWILGAAVLLAGLSFHHWLAQQENRSLREQLQQTSFLLLFWASFTLIGIGLTGTSAEWWETAVWALFTLFCLVNAVKTYKIHAV